MLGRFRAWYQDEGIAVDVIQSRIGVIRLVLLILMRAFVRFHTSVL